MPLYLENLQAFPNASSVNVVAPTADSVVPMRLQQHSATQSANLLTLEKANGTVLSSLDSTGGILTLGNGVDQAAVQFSMNSSFANSMLFRIAGADKWSINPNATCTVRDLVNSRNQFTLIPGAAGLANALFLDQVRVQAGAGQAAGQLVFYASDGTTIQASLIGDAANTLALRNGANAQQFNVYNTFTDTSNWERLHIFWQSNIVYVQTAKAGTGTVRNLRLTGNGLTLLDNSGGGWQVGAGDGHLRAFSDNVYSIGLSGQNRPSTGYFGTSVVAPVFTANVGGSTGTMNGHGTANIQTSSAGVGNAADTTDDTLFTYTLPINALSAAGKSLRVRAWGTFGATANTKAVKLWFAGTALVNSGVLTLSGKNWTIEYEVTAVDATHVSTTGSFMGDTASVQDVTVNANLAVSDLTANTSIIKVTGASTITGAASDVLGYGMKVWFEN